MPDGSFGELLKDLLTRDGEEDSLIFFLSGPAKKIKSKVRDFERSWHIAKFTRIFTSRKVYFGRTFQQTMEKRN